MFGAKATHFGQPIPELKPLSHWPNIENNHHSIPTATARVARYYGSSYGVIIENLSHTNFALNYRWQAVRLWVNSLPTALPPAWAIQSIFVCRVGQKQIELRFPGFSPDSQKHPTEADFRRVSALWMMVSLATIMCEDSSPLSTIRSTFMWRTHLWLKPAEVRCGMRKSENFRSRGSLSTASYRLHYC